MLPEDEESPLLKSDETEDRRGLESPKNRIDGVDEPKYIDCRLENPSNVLTKKE